jgi:thiol-disulfide isomerase/thioredoxin
MSKKSAFVVFTALLLQLACQNAAPPVSISKQPISVNNVRQPDAPAKPIREMSWTGVNGGEQRMADLKDKVVILDFWATYCPPCREEIPHLNSLQAKYGTEKLQIVGLNVGGSEDQPKIPAFAKQLKVSYPIAFPEQPLVDYIFGDDDSIPQTAVFDRNGQLVLKLTGFGPEIKGQLDDAVESAIQQ